MSKSKWLNIPGPTEIKSFRVLNMDFITDVSVYEYAAIWRVDTSVACDSSPFWTPFENEKDAMEEFRRIKKVLSDYWDEE